MVSTLLIKSNFDQFFSKLSKKCLVWLTGYLKKESLIIFLSQQAATSEFSYKAKMKSFTFVVVLIVFLLLKQVSNASLILEENINIILVSFQFVNIVVFIRNPDL